MRNIFLIALIGALFLTGCQLSQTKVTTETTFAPKAASAESDQVFITELKKRGAILVDARSPFVSGLNRIPGAQNLWWEDLTVKNSAGVRKMHSDLFSLARRLALKGIAPGTPVVLVGDRSASSAQDGRLAWMLSYIGIKEVYVLDVSRFRVATMNLQESVPVVPAPVWLPEAPKDLLLVSKVMNFNKNKNMFVICLKLENNEAIVKNNVKAPFWCDRQIDFPWAVLQLDSFAQLSGSGKVALESLQVELKSTGSEVDGKKIVVAVHGGEDSQQATAAWVIWSSLKTSSIFIEDGQ